MGVCYNLKEGDDKSMKKLVSIFTVLLISIVLSACTPDENTAQDIQEWYDLCEQITSCAEKIDELRESELTESEIIQSIKESIADHEARLDELENSTQSLEERVAMVNSIELGPSATYDLVQSYNANGAVGISDNNNTSVVILVNFNYLVTDELTFETLKTEFLNAIKTDLGNVYAPDDVIIRISIEVRTEVGEDEFEIDYTHEDILLLNLLD